MYDFIVVGAGPSGIAAATSLARSSKKITVLLLEAGDSNSDPVLRVDGQRWLTFQSPEMNWGYKTVPQVECYDRKIDYSRGKGLGGSSAINFGVYTIGCRDDYDEWARIVGDSSFGWEKMHARFKQLETFHGDLPSQSEQKYANPKQMDHGYQGGLHVGYAKEWERDLGPMLDVFDAAGFNLNADVNSGNPLGMSVAINSSYRGRRTTAKDLLQSPQENLVVLTGVQVQKLLWDGKKVVGVKSNINEYLASKEVILSAGTLDTPRILMHSGIGPPEQLRNYGIHVIQNIFSVGKNLRDRPFCLVAHGRKGDSTDRPSFYGNQQSMDVALEQWKIDGTGPWSVFACQGGIGYFKINDVHAIGEFQKLSLDQQEFIQAQTVPHYEIETHFPAHWFLPNLQNDMSYAALVVFLMNCQSQGEVVLQSPDPSVPLLFDPKFLSHPFDRRLAIESLKEVLKVINHPVFAKDTVCEIAGPKSASEDDLLDYWRRNLGSTYHMAGTAKMGKQGDPSAVVDPAFRVFGVHGLRVADMSVVPILPNCHPQTTAYVTGMTCAEKLITEYNLA